MRSAAVNIPAVADCDDQYQQKLVANCVDDPVIASTNTVQVGLSFELDGTRRPRVGGETVDDSSHPLSRRLVQFPKRSRG